MKFKTLIYILIQGILLPFYAQAQNKDKRNLDDFVKVLKYGSLKELDGEVLIVNFWVNCPNSKKWDTKKMNTYKPLYEKAGNWLSSKVKDYKKNLTFTNYDYPISKDFKLSFVPETGGEGDPITEILNFLHYETESDFLDDLDKKVGKQYQNIIFTINLDGEGRSYANNSTTLDNGTYFLEYFVFFTSYQGRSALDKVEEFVIPHEILHLTGAIDLYEEEYKEGVTTERMKAVQDNLYYSIMFVPSMSLLDDSVKTYDMNIDEFTAYLMGWNTTYKPYFGKIFYEDVKYKFYLEQKNTQK